MDKKSYASSGLGFTSVLQLIFITLKLLKMIDWSWLWVLAPTWISILVVLLAIGIGVILVLARSE